MNIIEKRFENLRRVSNTILRTFSRYPPLAENSLAKFFVSKVCTKNTFCLFFCGIVGYPPSPLFAEKYFAGYESDMTNDLHISVI